MLKKRVYAGRDEWTKTRSSSLSLLFTVGWDPGNRLGGDDELVEMNG
jgi:hypothetical protein